MEERYTGIKPPSRGCNPMSIAPRIGLPYRCRCSSRSPWGEGISGNEGTSARPSGLVVSRLIHSGSVHKFFCESRRFRRSLYLPGGSRASDTGQNIGDVGLAKRRDRSISGGCVFAGDRRSNSNGALQLLARWRKRHSRQACAEIEAEIGSQRSKLGAQQRQKIIAAEHAIERRNASPFDGCHFPRIVLHQS